MGKLKGFSIIPETRFMNRTTTVEKYIVEIAKYKILPENELRTCIERYKTYGDQNCKRMVFESCAKFVVTCAKKYQNQGVDFMDLINAGNYGVLDALEHFKLDVKNCKFVSYAMYYIRLYIHEALSECMEHIKMPVKVKRDDKNYREGSSFRTVGKIVLQPDTFSLNEPLYTQIGMPDNAPASENLMTDDSWNTYNDVYRNMDIEYYLEALDFTEREVIINIFGLYNYPTKTLDEIASMLRLKKQKVISLRDNALRKMNRIATR